MNKMTIIHNYNNINGYNPIIRILHDGHVIEDLDAFAPLFSEIDGRDPEAEQLSEYIAAVLLELDDNGIELTDAIIEDVNAAAAAWVDYSTSLIDYEYSYLR